MPRQATGRATIKPVERVKDGRTYWSARGMVPFRRPDGKVGSRPVERGFDESVATERQREARCAEWNREYEELFRNPRRVIAFAKAWDNYIAFLGEENAPLYEVEILQELGAKQCDEIDDSAMVDLCKHKFPGEDATPATLNRHLYTPVIACLRMALKEKAPMLQRPKGHSEVKEVETAAADWFRAVWPELNANQQALVMLLASHGRRIGEALSRRPKDLVGNRLSLGKTKTGLMEIELEPQVLALIQTMPGWRSRKWLFNAGPNSANSVRRDLRAACQRAGVAWITPHKFGRHTSVTRMLRARYSVAHVAQAHNMTPEMVTRRYGHLTAQETTEALHRVGGELVGQVINGGVVGEERRTGKVGNGISRLITKEDLSERVLPALLPSEGDALSNCATGADQKPSNFGVSSGDDHPEQART